MKSTFRWFDYGCSLVRLVDIVDSQDGEVAIVAEVTESDASSWLDAEIFDSFFKRVEADGHTPKVAVCKAAVLDNAAWC